MIGTEAFYDNNHALHLVHLCTAHTLTHSLWYCYLSEITLMRCSCAFERAICFVYNLICYIVSSRKLLFIFCRQGRVYLVSYHKYIISDYYYYSYFIDKALSIRCVFFVMSCNLWYCQIFSPTKNRCFFCRSKWFFPSWSHSLFLMHVCGLWEYK